MPGAGGTPGIPEHKKAVVALVTAGVEMDVLGFAYNDFDEQQRLGVVAAHPRGNHFKKNIIDAFYHGMEHRPDSTFGTVNDDVLAYKNPKFNQIDARLQVKRPNAFAVSYLHTVSSIPIK